MTRPRPAATATVCLTATLLLAGVAVAGGPPAPTGLLPVPSPCGTEPRITLTWDDPAPEVTDQLVEVGLTSGGTDLTLPAGLGTSVLVEGLVPDTEYFFRVRAFDSMGGESLSEETMVRTPGCSTALLNAGVMPVADECAFGAGDADGRYDPGERLQVAFSVQNDGTGLAPEVSFRAESRSPFVTVLTGDVDLGDLDVGEFAIALVDLDVSATAPCGEPLSLLARSASTDGAAWGTLVPLGVPPDCQPCSSPTCVIAADAGNTAPRVVCRGRAVALDAGASAAVDCPGVLLYEWWDESSGNRVSTSLLATVGPSDSRTYRLVVRCSTDFACTAEDTVDITVNQLPVITFAEDPPPPHCEGDVVTLTAMTADPMAVFDWDSGEVGPAVSVSSQGVFEVTVTDTNGCSTTASRRLEFGPVPDARAGPDVMACSPRRIGEPGFPLLDYEWSPAEGLSSPFVAQPEAYPAMDTTYTLTVTDPTSGCFTTDDVLVEVSPPPQEVLTGLRVSRMSGGVLRFTWDVLVDADAARVYGEPVPALARGARGSSPTAAFACEGPLSCESGPFAESILFFQAVGACADGVTEGPN